MSEKISLDSSGGIIKNLEVYYRQAKRGRNSLQLYTKSIVTDSSCIIVSIKIICLKFVTKKKLMV